MPDIYEGFSHSGEVRSIGQRDERMHAEGGQVKHNAIAVLLKGNGRSARAACCRCDLLVGLDADLYVVQFGEIGQKADVAAVDGRCVKHVKSKEAVALAQTNSAARGKFFGLDHLVVKCGDRIFGVFFKHVVARFVVSPEDRVSEIQHVSAFYQCGIVCGLGVVGCVFVTRVVPEGAAEIGLEHLGKTFAVALGLVCGGVGKEGGDEILDLASDVVLIEGGRL